MFVAHIDLLTRFELFLRRHKLQPREVVKATRYSRQHLLRVRLGDASPTRRFIADMIAACEKLSHERVTANTLFERGGLLLASTHNRLSRLFVHDFEVLDALLANVTEGWADRVLNAGVASETAVRYLLRAAEPLIDQRPEEAAIVYHATAAMANTLPDTAPELAASLSGHALKGRSNALRHLADFDAALADLALASRLFLSARYCVNEAGQVEYTRGAVLFKMERWDEADEAARQARARFVTTGDTRRAAHADILRAGILFDEGQVDAARDIWMRVMSVLADLDDSEALARVWQNVGACEIRRRRAPEARQWLTWAAAAFRALGNRTELVRTRWNIATYVATFRSVRRGIRLLQQVQREFSELGALADAGCVGLDAVDWMVETRVADATLTRYAQDVARLLTRAGLAVSGAEALERLRYIARSRNRRQVVEEVRVALHALDEPCRPVAVEGREAGGRPGLIHG